MPELPEVETVRIGLAALLPGKTIRHVEHDWQKSFPNAQTDVDQFLIGASVTTVRRRAKVLMIDLSTEYTLVIHLKMTGQLVYVRTLKSKVQSPNPKVLELQPSSPTVIGDPVKKETPYNWIPDPPVFLAGRTGQVENDKKGEERFGAGHPNDSLISDLPDKSTRVTFTFSDDSHLFFNDFRKFGWVKLYPTIEVPNIDFMQKVGPEPLGDDFTEDVMFERIQRRKNSNIKAVLLDQTVLAGVGNIYADESLWGAKIHPENLVKNLSKKQVATLHHELRYVLELAIEKGGSTDRNYVNAEGKKGSYMDFARVFRREKLPCPRCGTTIIKTRVAARGTHTCPKCQKAR
jgi:formamidopyrimidine-DNA glycosylase